MKATLRRLVKRARQDKEFLESLLEDPVRAVEGFDLHPHDREALTANAASRLLSLVAKGAASSRLRQQADLRYHV